MSFANYGDAITSTAVVCLASVSFCVPASAQTDWGADLSGPYVAGLPAPTTADAVQPTSDVRLDPELLKIRFQSAPPRARASAPTAGSEFKCEDGSKLVLSFATRGDSVDALVWLKGVSYRLPHHPPEPGPVQIVWSDGVNSLTWSPGVRLMWMNKVTHLMCGRGGHQH